MASIQEIVEGKKYKLYVELGYRGKRRIRRTKTVYVRNITEARKELVKFEAMLLSKHIIDEDNMTLGAFYPQWHDKHAIKHYGASTLEMMVNNINTRIMPEFKTVKLKDITKLDVISFMDELKPLNKKKDELASSTIHNIYKAFNDLMKTARSWDLIDNNPCDNITLPKLQYKESEVYTIEQSELLFERLKKYNHRSQLIVKIAALSGARQGEIAAIENKHLDFNNNTLRIEQAFVNVAKKGLILKGTKTENRRTVTIPPDLMSELFNYTKEKKKQLFEMQNLRKWEGHTFLFSDEFGKPLRPDSISQWWIRFMNTNSDLKRIRFHDLRHTSATLLLQSGISPKVIQKRLGHSKITTTLDTYSHVLEEMDQEASDAFDVMFGGGKDKEGKSVT